MRIKMPAVRIAQADVEMQQQHSDVLTCGACQKAFALGDIVRFIQHKVLACNKENYSCDNKLNNESGDSDDGGGTSLLGVVNSSRRPSISAPMKKVTPTSGGRVLVTTSPADDEPRCSTPKRRPLDDLHETEDEIKSHRIKEELDSSNPLNSSEEGPCKKLRTMSDAQSNTINSEPSNYVCSTCKARLHSAWRLIQHVQTTHGIKIYVDSSPSTSSPSSSSPGTSNVNKNQSSSSTCSSSSSGCSSGGNPLGLGTPLSLSSQPRLGLPSSSPIVEPHLPLHTPFSVGGLLRMPLEPPRHHQFPPSSLGPSSGSIFARPSSHNEHHFRMEQLVSEQFRLSQQHSLGLAAAVAAASCVPPPHSPFAPIPTERPPIQVPTTVTRTSVPPPSLSLSLEPQLDFYSQRLRQLAGTTSPGAANGNSSPSPRKLTPPFTSPNNSLPPPVTIAPSLSNNNNNNSTTNNNINQARDQSLTPPSENKPVEPNEPIELRTTPRSSSTPPTKPTDFSISSENNDADRVIHSCDYCGKKFRFHSNLIVHIRSHTGEKPYKCSVCNHACSQSSKLKRHMKVHKRNRIKEDGANGSANSIDHASEGSVTNDEDDDDDEIDDEEEEEEEEEEMELESDEDDDFGGDAPEDLTTKSPSSTPPTDGKNGSPPNEKVPTGSLVGELMDKYGLSNIQQYSEAYKQALQESVGAHHIISRKDDFHNSHLLSENNNIGKPRIENGFLEKSAAALRFREEFAKNMITGQPPLDLVGGPHGLFSPFDNPYEASKRLKLEQRDSLGRTDRDGLFANMWLPMAAAHHRDHMFGNNGSDSDILKDKSKNTNPSTSASLAAAAAAAAAINLGLPQKKESRRNDTCEYCGKVFKNCSNLTVHRRSHTGEKPYKCELCSYACAQSSKLTRHMKTHGRMGKDVYRCRFCEMPFSVPSTLEKHMRKCVVNQNIKVEHMLPSMLSGDEDSAASTPKDATST